MDKLGCGAIIGIGIATFMLMLFIMGQLTVLVLLVPIIVTFLLAMLSDQASVNRNKAVQQGIERRAEEKERLARSRDCKICGARWHELTEMEHAELKKEIYHHPDCPWY